MILFESDKSSDVLMYRKLAPDNTRSAHVHV